MALASSCWVYVSDWKQELFHAGQERLQLRVWVGRGNVAVGKCQFVKMETFGKNRSVLTNFCPNTAREALGRWEGGARGTHPPHPRRGGLTGLVPRGLLAPPAPHSAVRGFLSHLQNLGKRLKTRVCGWGQAPRAWDVPKVTPAPCLEELGGPAGGSLDSAQTPPDRQLRQLRTSSSCASF